MGIAASEARYLSLIARQSNCEFQGEQIHQAILNLSGKSSMLFSQMLDMQVPIPPSKTDYTSIQYMFTDEATKTTYTVKRWQALVNDPDDCNYSITYTTDADEEIGNKTNLPKPGIQFELSGGITYAQNAEALREAKNYLNNADFREILEFYSDSETFGQINSSNIEIPEEESDPYTINVSNIKGYQPVVTPVGIFWEKDGLNYVMSETRPYTFSLYEGNMIPVEPTSEEICYADVSFISRCGTFKEQGYILDTSSVVDNADGTRTILFVRPDNTIRVILTPVNPDPDSFETFYQDGLNNCNSTISIDYNLYKYEPDRTTPRNLEVKEALTKLSEIGAINLSELNPDDVWCYRKVSTDSEGNKFVDRFFVFKDDLDAVINSTSTSLRVYNPIDVLNKENAEIDTYYGQNPQYIGDSPLTKLSSLTTAQAEKISEIIKGLEKRGISSSLKDCFTKDGVYDNTTYRGGIYTYTANGKTYYVTYDDMITSYIAGNSIDEQSALPTYSSNISPAGEDRAAKAYIERSPAGRLVTLRFPHDEVVHNLEIQEVSDEAGYENAMQQYNYNLAKYDEAVADINAQLSLIHSQDKQLDLQLSQLDTERTALKTEIEAVQKVLKNNVEKSFKTFGD